MKKPLENLHWTAQITLVFLFKHLVAGVLGGFLLAGLLLYYNVGNLWSMISNSDDMWIPLYLLFIGLGITFGSVSMGWGIFSLAQERDGPTDNTTYY